MSRNFKRAISLLLAMIMVVSVVSVVVSAEEVDVIVSKSTDNNTKVGLAGTFNDWRIESMSPVYGYQYTDVYSITITVEKGVYEFKIWEDGYQMGNDDDFTDTVSNIIFSRSKGNCVFTATGGKYKFTYDSISDKLTVRRLEGPNKKVSLSGNFNFWFTDNEKSSMTEVSQDIFSKTIELEAGTYQFKIVEDGVWLGNDSHFTNTTQYICDDGFNMVEERGNCFLNADGGMYTFIYNAITDKLIVIWNGEMSESTLPTDEIESSMPSTSETDLTEPSSSQNEPSANVTEPTEHSWGNEKLVLPDCENKGKVEYTCIHCGEIKKEIIRANGHNFSSVFIIDRKATCTTKGRKSRHCLNCNAVTDVTEIQPNKKAHTIVKDKEVYPSCSKEGLTEGSHCTECNEVIVAQKKVKKIAHKNTDKKISYFKYGYEYKTICRDCKTIISQGVVSDKSKIKTPEFSVKSGKKEFTVNYKKVSEAKGYQIKYVKENTEITETFKSDKSLKKVIKNINKGTYKVYVRAFVKYEGKRYYSSWTKAKKVKVK